jgi:ketosteroid isomerase-like protein
MLRRAMAENEPELAVLAANERFYRAFNDGDLRAMSELWAGHSPVACLHPGEALLVGREAVLRRWREILSARPNFTLRCDGPTAQLFGATAIVYCYEGSDEHPAHLVATNVFVREGQDWRMVHHHAGPLVAPRPVPGSLALN